MTARQRLPNRRKSEIVSFLHEGRKYRAQISRFESDGVIGEIFLDCDKFGSDVSLHANEAAILASLAMQHGAAAADLCHTIAGPIATALGLVAGGEVP